jgi:hypothetical protein
MASLSAVNTNTQERDTPSIGSGAVVSRPDTPLFARSGPVTPSPRGSFDFGASLQLRADNDLLKGIIQQDLREKKALMDTIDNLQRERAQLREQHETMKAERAALLEEREALQNTIKRLQFPNGVNPYAQHGLGVAMRSPSGPNFPSNNPWGAIGSGTRSRPDTPVETPAESPALPPRSFSYATPGSLGLAGNFHGLNASAAVTSSGPSSSLNATAPVYGSAMRLSRTGHGTAGSSGGKNNTGGDGAEGERAERVQNVLRGLGPSF